MSERHTSECKLPHRAVALLGAGWSDDDLSWEWRCEQAAEADLASDHEGAAAHWAAALRLARRHFSEADPRLATSMCNHAVGLRRAGEKDAAAWLFQAGVNAWNAAPLWVGAMRLDRLAGSSIFHLRLERRHAELYARQQRGEWLALARAGHADAAALADGRATGGRHRLERWRALRPQGYTDSRKLMAAAWLLAPGA